MAGRRHIQGLADVACAACGAANRPGSTRCAACGRTLRPGLLTAVVAVGLAEGALAGAAIARALAAGAATANERWALAAAAVLVAATLLALLGLLRGRYWAWLMIQVRWELDVAALVLLGLAGVAVWTPWKAVVLTAALIGAKLLCWMVVHTDRAKAFCSVGTRGRLLLGGSLYGVLALSLVVTLTPLVWLVAATLKNSDDLFHYLFFPPPANLSLENFQKLFGSPILSVGEVRDWQGFCGRLEAQAQAEAPSLGKRIWEGLAPAARERAAAVARGHDLTPAEERGLLDAFNAVLRRSGLVRPADLAGLALAGEALDLAARPQAGLSEAEAWRLSRDVLELAYPKEIAKGFRGIPFGRYLVNSVFVAGATVLIQMFFSSLGGFALAKYEFRFKKAIMVLMLGTMMIPGQVMLAPLYELIYRMGLMDSHAGLIVPGMVSVFGMFLFRQSMLQIPDELLEAARMDGCTEFGAYWNIALPVSRPMIGAFCLVAFMGNWNAFLWPQIILHTADRFTIPIGLNQMVGTYSQQYGIMMAGTLLAILPVMILFFILQREFISGLTAGAVKG